MLRCSKSQTLHSYIPWRRHPHPRLVPGGRRGGRGGEPLPRNEGPQHSRPESHGFAGIVFKGLRGCLEAVNGFEDGWIRSYTVTVSLSSLLPVHFALKRLSFLPPRPCTTLMFVGKGRGMDLCQNAKIGRMFPQPAEGKF